jgi:cytochrome b involved in lipid metabolism
MVADGAKSVHQFTSFGVILLILAWTAFWAVCHFVLWPCWIYKQASMALVLNPTPVQRYRRRLCRGQVYNLCAVIGGCYLMTRWESYPKDMLYDFEWEHQVLFSMAAGHWIISLWEDRRSAEFLGAGLDPEKAALSGAYDWHHMMACSGYLGMLYLKSCAAIGIFGFMFELPVLLMNHREFVINATPTPRWWRGRQIVRFWALLNTVFFVARYTPSIVYFYSIFVWTDDLAALDVVQRIVYHGMAIFFTILNYGLQVYYFDIWARHDMATCSARECKSHSHGHESNGAVRDTEQGTPVVIDNSVMPVVKVHPTVMDRKDGTHEEADGRPTELWIEIDGIAYNVTNFLSKHPGGEAVFRKHAGKDATAGFKRARHSQQAKIMMQKYLVGPIEKTQTQYRIFEHPEQLVALLWEYLTCALVSSVATLYVGWSDFATAAEPGSSLSRALVPGLMLSATCGIFAIIWNACCCNCGAFMIHRNGYRYGMFLVIFLVGITLARQPMPESLPKACPTGLELAAVAMLAWEEVCEAFETGFKRSKVALFIAAGAVTLSWTLREAWKLIDAAPGHVLAPLCIGPAMSWMVRRIGDTVDSDARQEMVKEVTSGVILSAVYGSLGLWLLLCYSPKEIELVYKLTDLTWDSFCGITFAGGICVAQVFVVMNSAYVCSPAWAARLTAIHLLLGTLGFQSFRWLVVVGALSLLSALGKCQRDALSNAQESGKFTEVPPYKIGTQAIWDQLRVFIFALLWRAWIRLVAGVVNRCTPQEMCFYGCEIPIFDLGEGVDLGVAAAFTPASISWKGRPAESKAEGEDDAKPNYFVCNVGHIDANHRVGLPDMQRTMNAVRDCWEEFADGEAPGLLSNVVCFFNTITGTSFAKQINLSAWSSEKAAHDWYVKSQGHKHVMRDHAGGRLRTFGNLLASLKPMGEIRHQDRCTRCARIVEDKVPGRRAPARCSFCGAETFGYPFI